MQCGDVAGAMTAAQEGRVTLDDALVELHHRVANSLQLISHFLFLQEREVADETAKSALNAAGLRLAAVGALHRAVILADGTDLDLGALLKTVCASAGEVSGLTVKVETCPATVSADTAEGVALIVNELILNAAKHAYGGRGGVVTVQCRRTGSKLAVTVADSGPGVPAPAAQAGLGGTGMRIMQSTTQRLNGSLEFDRGGVTLIIPCETEGDLADT